MHLTYLYVGKLRRPPDHASATLSPCPKISDVETPRTSSKVLKQWNFSLISLIHKKHIDASVKERPQTLLVPSEEFVSVFYAIHII